jgi:hypothetical protein
VQAFFNDLGVAAFLFHPVKNDENGILGRPVVKNLV